MSLAPFIVLEGIDGTGKTTQCRMLVDWLHARNVTAIHCTDPGSTELGEQLRSILLDRKRQFNLKAEALLFMASRSELVDKIIKPSLENNIVVICDRFLLSNVVYQGHAGGLDPEALWNIGNFSTDGIEPDLTFIFDLPVEQANLRRGKRTDRMEARDRDFQQRVREGFLIEANDRPDSLQVIDSSGSVQELHALLRYWVGGLLRRRGFHFPDGVP